MPDPTETTPVPPAANLDAMAESSPSDASGDRARSIYAAWRNTHLAHLPVEIFNRIEAAAEHLIAAIRKDF